MTPFQGTFIIGLSNAVAAILVLTYIGVVGRRPILITGQFFMSVWLFLCGLAVLNSWNLTAYIMIILFIFTFQLSQGSVAWLYIPEVCVDAASGLAVGS